MFNNVFAPCPHMLRVIQQTNAELRAAADRAVERTFAKFQPPLPDDITDDDLQTAFGTIIQNRAEEFAYTHHSAWRLLPQTERAAVLKQLEDRLVMDAIVVFMGLGLVRKEAA